jgi:ADP-heptose:LPS heptosyltransferase
MGRTVVLHPGALGDVLLAIPALRALRAQAPDDELVLVAQPRIGRLLASLAIVDRSLAFDTLGLETLFADDAPPERLRQLLAGARVVSWFGSGDAGFTRRLRALARQAVVASTVPSDGSTVWPHLVASVGPRAPVDARAEAWRAAIVVPRAMVADGRHALAGAGWDGTRPLVMLHPGAGGAAKRWAVDGFAEAGAAVVDALGADVVVHDGPADHDAVAGLRARLRVPASVLVDPPLEVLAGAMRHAALWIGNDSGVTHLAAAVGTPTLALFIAAHVAWRPWARPVRVRVVSVDALSRLDVEAVIAEAGNLRRPRAERAVGDRGSR